MVSRISPRISRSMSAAHKKPIWTTGFDLTRNISLSNSLGFILLDLVKSVDDDPEIKQINDWHTYSLIITFYMPRFPTIIDVRRNFHWFL